MPRLVPRREVSARELGAGRARPPNGEWVRVRMSSPLLVKVHGLLAVVGVFLLGWIMADHLTERRKLGRNYRSGVLLAGTAALLVLTGYALYYTTGTVHEV